jgi:hypothetical protein
VGEKGVRKPPRKAGKGYEMARIVTFNSARARICAVFAVAASMMIRLASSAADGFGWGVSASAPAT